MAEERRLGRGIGDLIKLNRGGEAQASSVTPAAPASLAPSAPATQVLQLAVDAVLPNPHQPRKHFSDQGMAELSRSVQQTGVLQPVVVRRSGNAYELVAGERRWRAARMAGLATVPAVVRDIPNERMLESALVENVQREDLNPLEKAQAYRKLMDQFGYTQQGLSERIGTDRSTVANTLRLLELPEPVKASLAKGSVSMGHARALLAVREDAAREALCRRIEAEGLSVRQVEQMASGPASKSLASAGEDRVAVPRAGRAKTPDVKALEDQLRQALGTKAEIRTGRGRRGKIVLEYYSVDDFNRLFKRLIR